MEPMLDTVMERFVDSDLHRKPALHALAVEYLQKYKGDFEFLRTARYHLQATGSLPYSMARGVLNCVRNDWNWQTRLVEVASSIEEVEVNPITTLYVVPELPELSKTVTLPVHYNWQFLYSIHQLARTVHLIDDDKSYAVWTRATNSITFHPYTYCQSVSHYWNPPLYPVFEVSKYPPDGRRACKRCELVSGSIIY